MHKIVTNKRAYTKQLKKKERNTQYSKKKKEETRNSKKIENRHKTKTLEGRHTIVIKQRGQTVQQKIRGETQKSRKNSEETQISEKKTGEAETIYVSYNINTEYSEMCRMYICDLGGGWGTKVVKIEENQKLHKYITLNIIFQFFKRKE